MRVLLGLSAALLTAVTLNLPAPAAAQHRDGSGVRTEAGQFARPSVIDSRLCRDRRGGGGRRGSRCSFASVTDFYGGEWALYNNRSWESDSYNDWWHDQPWRAYPAWMRKNEDCARPWYSGDVLRC